MKTVCLCFCFLHFFMTHVTDAVLPSSVNSKQGRGSSSGICEDRTMSCSHQVLNSFSLNDCNMTYIKNADCDNFDFSRIKPQDTNDRLHLHSYSFDYKAHKLSAFNITFPQSWKAPKFRIQQSRGGNLTLCRSFQIMSTVPNFTLFFDCVWAFPHLEGNISIFHLEFMDTLTLYGGNYEFQIPKQIYIDPYSTSLINWQVFMYVEHLDSELRLTFQKVPPSYNVTEYKLHFYCDNIPLHEEMVFANTTKGHEFVTRPFPRRCNQAELYATVKIVHRLCPLESEACTSMSPIIIIESNDLTNQAIYCGLIVISLFVILPVIFCVIRRKAIIPSKNLVKRKVLLLYRASHSQHIAVVEKLADYLEAKCMVQPLLDFQDIKKTDHRDPIKWYREAFDTSHVIIMLSSPNLSETTTLIYRGTYSVALRQLVGIMSKSPKTPVIFNAVLPYCTEDNLPDEVKHLVCFHLPKQFNQMLCHIHDQKPFPCNGNLPKMPGFNYDKFPEGRDLSSKWSEELVISSEPHTANNTDEVNTEEEEGSSEPLQDELHNDDLNALSYIDDCESSLYLLPQENVNTSETIDEEYDIGRLDLINKTTTPVSPPQNNGAPLFSLNLMGNTT